MISHTYNDEFLEMQLIMYGLSMMVSKENRQSVHLVQYSSLLSRFMKQYHPNPKMLTIMRIAQANRNNSIWVIYVQILFQMSRLPSITPSKSVRRIKQLQNMPLKSYLLSMLAISLMNTDLSRSAATVNTILQIFSIALKNHFKLTTNPLVNVPLTAWLH